MHGEWNRAEVRDALAAMQNEGLSQGEIAKMAGVNRSQVNRWARGENRPTYDKALQLARRVAARYPEPAARLMRASGYAWDGVAETEEPGLPTPEELDALREHMREVLGEESGPLEAALDAAVSGAPRPGRRGRGAGRGPSSARRRAMPPS